VVVVVVVVRRRRRRRARGEGLGAVPSNKEERWYRLSRSETICQRCTAFFFLVVYYFCVASTHLHIHYLAELSGNLHIAPPWFSEMSEKKKKKIEARQRQVSKTQTDAQRWNMVGEDINHDDNDDFMPSILFCLPVCVCLCVLLLFCV